MSCGEYDVISLYFMYSSANGSVCLLCLIVLVNCSRTIRNMFWCGCYLVVECYGSV